MLLALVRRYLLVKIVLLLLPMLVLVLGGVAWYLIDSRTRAVENENFLKAQSAAIVGARLMSHLLEDLLRQDLSVEQLFDVDYRQITEGPLAGTKIPKFHTAYDQKLDRVIQPLEDAFLTDPNIVFAVLVDRNGYLPTHNSSYAQPLDGNPAHELANNRTKRLFNDPVGLRAARFEADAGHPVLRQVYHRDTGVTMWDVSAPVKVAGRHWGAFRIGLSMERTDAGILHLKRTVVFSAMGQGLLVLVLMMLVVRHSIGPLRQLTEAAQAIADGKRQQPIDIDSRDEIGQLMQSFNQMQQSLAQTTVSRDFFDRIVNSIHDLLLVVSLKGEILRINYSVVATLDRTEEELCGSYVGQLFNDRQGNSDWFERLQKRHRLEAEDLFVTATHGNTLAVSLTGSALYDAQDMVDGYIVICQDNSRRVRAEQAMTKAFDQAFALNGELREVNEQMSRKNLELDEAYRQLKASQSQILQQEKMASIGQLAAGVAHEINNPLGFITSNLQTLNKYLDRINQFVAAQRKLLQETLDETALAPLQGQEEKLKIGYVFSDGRELIEESLEGAERVKKIVQNLKSFSRIDQADIAEVSLNDCLESTLSIAWNEIKYKAELERELGELDLLRCHPQQIHQVLLNILVNAAQAIPTRGIIRVRSWQTDQNQYVAISDTGCGIPEEIRSRIFEPFFTTKDASKGTGLGMSISYDIIKKHGGHIDLETQVGVGSTFTLVLPRNGIDAEFGAVDVGA
jgi:PAS domain S-box-containing protein